MSAAAHEALLPSALDMPLCDLLALDADLLHSLCAATALPPSLRTLPLSHNTGASTSPSPSFDHSGSSPSSPFCPASPLPTASPFSPTHVDSLEAHLSPSAPSSLPSLCAMSNPARANSMPGQQQQQQQSNNNTFSTRRPNNSNNNSNNALLDSSSAVALSQLVQGVPGLLFATNEAPPAPANLGRTANSGMMTSSGRRQEDQQEQLQQLLLLDALCQLGGFGAGGQQQQPLAFGAAQQQQPLARAQAQHWSQTQALPHLSTGLASDPGMGPTMKQEPLSLPLGLRGVQQQQQNLQQQQLLLSMSNSNSNSNSCSSSSQLLPGSFSLPQQQPAQLRSAHSAPPQTPAATQYQGQHHGLQFSIDRQHSAPSSYAGINSLVRVTSEATAACGLKRDSPWQQADAALPLSKARRTGMDADIGVSRQIDVQSKAAHLEQAQHGVAWSQILQDLELAGQAPAEAPGGPGPAGPEIVTALSTPADRRNVHTGVVAGLSSPGDKRNGGAAAGAAPEAPRDAPGVNPASKAKGVPRDSIPSSSGRSGEGQDGANKESDDEDLDELRGQGFSGDENQKTRVYLERERRHRIRDGIKCLRGKIRGKGNSASILKQAVSYIQTLETEVQALRKALEEKK